MLRRSRRGILTEDSITLDKEENPGHRPGLLYWLHKGNPRRWPGVLFWNIRSGYALDSAVFLEVEY